MGIDIVLVAAVDCEWNAILNCGLKFESHSNLKTTFKQCLRARTDHGLEIAAVLADCKGQVHASITACKLVYELQPFIILSVGIAAGLPKKTALFDVLIPEIVHDASLGKVELNPETNKREFKFDHRPGKCDRDVVASLKVHFERNYERCYDAEWLKTHPKLIEKIPLARPNWQIPKINTGEILCDNLVRNDAENLIATHADSFREVVGCEMESYGFTEAIFCLPRSGPIFPPLFAMVKGVVDFALKKDSDFQDNVAGSVAKCLYLFLTETFPKTRLMSLIGTWRANRNKNNKECVLNLIGNQQSAESALQETVGVKLIDSALSHNESIIGGAFSINVDPSSRYLTYAAPMFGPADLVFAISIDSVSRFWTAAETIQLARDYLNAQEIVPNRRVKRGFIFHSAEEAHRYGHVLDAHSRVYRDVFLCSAKCYPKLIEGAVIFDHSDHILRTDFAILGYPPKIGGACPRYVGTLDAQRFTFYRADGFAKIPGVGKFDLPKLEELFAKFDNLRKGHIGEVKTGFGTVDVLAWEEGLWEKKSKWTQILKSLFPEDNREAMHMVFLCPKRNMPEELRGRLIRRFSKIKGKLLEIGNDGQVLAQKYNVIDIRFEQRIKNLHGKAIDHKTGGRLSVGENNPCEFILKLRFKSERDLLGFYNDEKHSELRHAIYALVSPLAEVVLKESRSLNSRELREGIFELVEADVSQTIHRLDLLIGDQIESIVEQPPYPC